MGTYTSTRQILTLALTSTLLAACGYGSSGTPTGNGTGNTTGSGGAQVQASYLFRAVVPQLVQVKVKLTAKSCHP